jgi:hypothetical protein
MAPNQKGRLFHESGPFDWVPFNSHVPALHSSVIQNPERIPGSLLGYRAL